MKHPCFWVSIQKNSQKELKLELIMTSSWHNMPTEIFAHVYIFLAALSSSWSLVVRRSVRRSVGPSVRLPMWKSDLLSIKWEWLSKWVTEWVSDWVSEWVSDWVTELLSDWVTEWLSDWVTEFFVWLKKICDKKNLWLKKF